MKIGSEAHKELFCQSFIASHREYDPETLAWPQLDTETLERLRGIPFWEEAFDTERKAGAMVSAYAQTVSDPLLREAIALQGIEEARHSRLIETLIKRYGIETQVRPEHEIPKDIEQAFTQFGYGECFDSFFAFGLFAIARQSGLFPEAFFTIFDPIIDEEARHIVFFVNWVAYQQVNKGQGASVLRAAHSLWQYSGALQRRLGSFRSTKTSEAGSGKGFTASGASAVSVNLTPELFLSTCLQENQRRMSVYDERLLRPEVMPMLTSAVYRIFKLLPQRKPGTEASPVVH